MTTPATASTWEWRTQNFRYVEQGSNLGLCIPKQGEIKRNQYERWLASWVAYMFWRDLCLALKTDMPDARYLLKRTKITYSVLDNTGAFGFEA
ncbi:MAG: hypothetical protein AAGD43_31145 [Pseudomonadota bacterium]